MVNDAMISDSEKLACPDNCIHMHVRFNPSSLESLCNRHRGVLRLVVKAKKLPIQCKPTCFNVHDSFESVSESSDPKDATECLRSHAKLECNTPYRWKYNMYTLANAKPNMNESIKLRCLHRFMMCIIWGGYCSRLFSVFVWWEPTRGCTWGPKCWRSLFLELTQTPSWHCDVSFLTYLWGRWRYFYSGARPLSGICTLWVHWGIMRHSNQTVWIKAYDTLRRASSLVSCFVDLLFYLCTNTSLHLFKQSILVMG